MQTELPKRKRLPHDPPAWIPDDAVFFITVSCAAKKHNQLCIGSCAKALIESIRFRHDRGDWFVHLVVLMPDHLHLLASFPREGSMRRTVREWKRYTARILNIEWQRDFFDHRLRDEKNYMEKAQYIRMNPVRKGLVAQPEDWPHCWTPER